MSTKKERRSYDYILKIIVIGPSGVGKTSLLTRYAEDRMEETHLATIGIDFKIRSIIAREKYVKLQLWDTAGQERFEALIDNYFRGAKGILYVFSLDDVKSFEALPRFIARAENHQIPCSILIGNKADLKEQRKITPLQIKSFCEKYDNMEYIETSAKSGQNVVDAFQKLTENLVDTMEEAKRMQSGGKETIKDVYALEGTDPFAPDLELKKEETKKKSCC